MPQRSVLRPLLALIGASLAFALVVATARVDAQAPPPAIPIGPTSPPTTVPGANPAATIIPSPSAVVSSSPASRGRKGRANPTQASTPAPEPSGTPTSPAFATLDGSWEVQLQYIDHTDYSYLDVVQGSTGTLSGNWRVDKKSYPFNGTYDGRTFNLLVAGPKGNITWAGYVEAASDMVGTVDLGDGKTEKTAFTAEHRPSSKGLFFKEKPNDPKAKRTGTLPGSR